MPELLKHVSPLEEIGNYYEPFIGGGAFFFALQKIYVAGMGKPLKTTINDNNPDLINVYRQVRNDVRKVIEGLQAVDNTLPKLEMREYYYHIRDAFNSRGNDHIAQAVRFLAMNSWGFNGLCRYNHSGGFNVPCGKFAKTPVLMDKADNLRRVSDVLEDVIINQGDFAKSLVGAKKGDLVYFDPPYIPVNATSDFTSYTAGGFDMSQQQRLMLKAVELVSRGVHVIVSNSDTPATRALWDTWHSPMNTGPDVKFTLHKVQARRAVNCNAAKRGKVGELIIVGRT